MNYTWFIINQNYHEKLRTTFQSATFEQIQQMVTYVCNIQLPHLTVTSKVEVQVSHQILYLQAVKSTFIRILNS